MFFFFPVTIISEKSWPRSLRTTCSIRSSVLSFTGVFGSYMVPQILTHGETCSHLVTLYLKSTILPSIWTITWPETNLWKLYIWRASMRFKQATGRFTMTDTLVSIIHSLSSMCMCAGDHVSGCFQLCCRLAMACLWVVEVFQMCTTPSSCTSTGEAWEPMGRSTQWTDADTRWRYSMVSRQLYTVTNQLLQYTGAVQLSLNVFVLFGF